MNDINIVTTKSISECVEIIKDNFEPYEYKDGEHFWSVSSHYDIFYNAFTIIEFMTALHSQMLDCTMSSNGRYTNIAGYFKEYRSSFGFCMLLLLIVSLVLLIYSELADNLIANIVALIIFVLSALCYMYLEVSIKMHKKKLVRKLQSLFKE